MNVKVIQGALDHKDISAALSIYTDVTKELKCSEFEGLDLYFKNEKNNIVLMFPYREYQDFSYEVRSFTSSTSNFTLFVPLKAG